MNPHLLSRRQLKGLAQPRFRHAVNRWWKRQCCPLSSRVLLDGIDPDRIAYLQRRYCEPDRLRRRLGYLDARRYLDVRRFLETSRRDAQEIGLRRSVARGGRARALRVLDLGAGPGYFGYICSQLGHHCVNLDCDDDVIYTELLEVLGQERILHRITPEQALPVFADKFDLIAGLAVGFHHCESGGVWGAEAWSGFLASARSLLKPGGRLYLRFNAEHLLANFDAPVARVFLDHGFALRGPVHDLDLSRGGGARGALSRSEDEAFSSGCLTTTR